MMLIMLINRCLNEMNSEVRIRKNMISFLSTESKKRFLIITAFQLANTGGTAGL
jgi:hypothetical protein